VKDISKILCDILQHELSLPNGRVVLYDQNFKAPNDDALYIVVGQETSQVIANTKRFDPEADQMVQKVVTATKFFVEFTSKNSEAWDRMYEIIGAVNSYYSEQKQEENTIKIYRTQAVNDLSLIEGPSSLHRYRFSVIINSVKEIRKDVETFDSQQQTEVLI